MNTTPSETIHITPDTLPPTFTRGDLDRYSAIIFDLDGCIWDQYKFLSTAHATLTTLTSLGKDLIFCSNNAAAYHSELMDCFAKNEFPITYPNHNHPALPKQLYTAALTTAAWCKNWFQQQGFDIAKDDKVLFCGEGGFYKEMLDQGFLAENIVNVIDVAKTIKDKPGLVQFKVDPAVKCVVMGFNREYNYVQAAVLTRYLHELHIPLISTNPDTSFSVPGGFLLPEFGGFVLQLEATVGRKALVSCGKPNREMFEQIIVDHKMDDKKKILMVGDNLLTDIKFGQNCEIDTLLVFSGVTHPSFVKDSATNNIVMNNAPSAAHNLMNKHQCVPTFIAQDISALIGGVTTPQDDEPAAIANQQ